MSLYLPPAVRAEMETKNHALMGKALDRALQEYDPNLSLVWVKSDIPPWEVPENVKPGRWHVKQATQLGPRYYAIVAPNGDYRDPDFGVLREMQARDLWHTRIPEAPLDPRKSDPEHRTLEDEQRVDEMKADYRAARRVAGENVHKRSWGKK